MSTETETSKSVTPTVKALQNSANNDRNVKALANKKMFNEFLQKLDKLEQLKSQYRKIDDKRNLLEQAICEMDLIAEQVYTNQAEFNIVLTKKEGDKTRELITLVSPEIVGKLTKFLLTEINSLLEMFEIDFLEFKTELGK